ncbi:MAG: DNA recombination protein RmuC [Muribaculum sp.]|nr:DNA recombination protein RmuC [Muribaculum sp.]
MEITLLIIVILILGATCTALIFRLNSHKSDSVGNDRNVDLETLLSMQMNNLMQAQQQQIIQLQQQHQQQIESMQLQQNNQMIQLKEEFERRSTELNKRYEEMTRTASLQLQNLTNESLRTHQERLGLANADQLKTILEPLKTRIEDFSRAANQAYVNENATRKSLSDQIERLMILNTSIGEEARNLASALRTGSKVQGDWGETILQQILENAGLKEDIHFSTQVASLEDGSSLIDEDGRRRRPDLILNLPSERKIVIDSKVSLTAYMDYTESDSDEDRSSAARRLVTSVRRHVDELSAKAYHKLIKGAAEQVLMFLPIEGAYFTAVDHDHTLPEYALKKKVVIVTPTHLLSVVQLIEQIWRVENQNANAAEIARLGGLIHDKMVIFANDLEAIHKGLSSADQAYEKCLKDITTGPTSIMARTQKMKQLGAKTDKVLPPNIKSAIELNSYGKTSEE